MVAIRKNLKSGFSLMELLIVIAIIAVLISVATVSYSSAQAKSRNSRRMADMKAIQSALELYYTDAVSYPLTAACNELIATNKYFPSQQFPKDPKSTASYTVACTGAGTGYCVCSRLEPNGNLIGNADSSACLGFSGMGTGEYYCVRQLQ